jgi:hypothetical protein
LGALNRSRSELCAFAQNQGSNDRKEYQNCPNPADYQNNTLFPLHIMLEMMRGFL